MKIFYPPDYLETEIKKQLLSNDKVDKEKVWTYLIAKKFEYNHSLLIKKLCRQDEIVPKNSVIWLEAHFDKPREYKDKHPNYGEVIADLSIGFLEKVPNFEARIKSNGDWICIAEAKWGSDDRLKENKRNQLAKLIESSLLLESNLSKLPEKVYVTLITPKYMTLRHSHFKVKYFDLFKKYQNNYKNIEYDLECEFKFKKYNQSFLEERIRNNLKLNWVTYEELLEIENLMETKIPEKFRTARESWQDVFQELNMKKLYDKLIR